MFPLFNNLEILQASLPGVNICPIISETVHPEIWGILKMSGLINQKIFETVLSDHCITNLNWAVISEVPMSTACKINIDVTLLQCQAVKIWSDIINMVAHWQWSVTHCPGRATHQVGRPATPHWRPPLTHPPWGVGPHARWAETNFPRVSNLTTHPNHLIL